MARLLPLSKGCQYAIRTAAFFSLEPPGTVFPRQEASRRTKIPEAFLSKILQAMTKAGLLHSHRGAQRGYSLARPAGQVSLLDVVFTYDCPLGHEGCLLDGHKLCRGERVCALHHRRMDIQNKLMDSLGSISVADAAKTLFTPGGEGKFKLAS